MSSRALWIHPDRYNGQYAYVMGIPVGHPYILEEDKIRTLSFVMHPPDFEKQPHRCSDGTIINKPVLENLVCITNPTCNPYTLAKILALIDDAAQTSSPIAAVGTFYGLYGEIYLREISIDGVARHTGSTIFVLRPEDKEYVPVPRTTLTP